MLRAEGRLSLSRGTAHSAGSWGPLVSGAIFGAWVVTWTIVIASVLAGQTTDHKAIDSATAKNCARGGDSSCSDGEASAGNTVAEAMPGLTISIDNVARALDNLRRGIELAAIHRRVSDVELLIGQWHEKTCSLEQCETRQRQTCGGRSRPADPGAIFDTIGPCVRREKVGEVLFALESFEPREDQQAEISRITERIREELRFVFVVGYADGPEFSWKNRHLGLRRARYVAKALRNQLASVGGTGSENDVVKITAVSGVDWAPTTACQPSHHGKAGVYLLWYGASPLCSAGRPMALM